MSNIYKKARSKMSSSARRNDTESTLNSSTASLQSEASSSVAGSRPSLRSLSIRSKSRRKPNTEKVSSEKLSSEKVPTEKVPLKKSSSTKSKSAITEGKSTSKTKSDESSGSSTVQAPSVEANDVPVSKKEKSDVQSAPVLEEVPSQPSTRVEEEGANEVLHSTVSPALESSKLLGEEVEADANADKGVDSNAAAVSNVLQNELNETEIEPEQPNESNATEYSPLLQTTQGDDSNSIHTESVAVAPGLLWSIVSMLKKFFAYLGIQNSKTATYVVAALAIVFLLGYLLISRSDNIVRQAISVNFQDIKISEVDDEGFESQIAASLYVNYDRVRNVFDRSFLKIATMVIGTVSVSPNTPVSLYLSTKELNDIPLHLVNLKLPEIKVDLINHRLTELNFQARTDLMKENIVEFINAFNDIDSESSVVNLQCVFDSQLAGSFFSFNSREVNLYEKFNVSKKELMPNLSLSNFGVKSTDDSIDVVSTLELDNVVPVVAELPPINWALSLESCSKKMIDVGIWETSSLKLEPHVPIKLNIDAKIKEIDGQLTKFCDGKDMSPLNIMLKSYLEEQPLKFFVHARDQQKNKLPTWMLYILQNTYYMIELSMPMQSLDVKDYLIESFGIDIPSIHSRDNADSLIMNANSNFSLSLDSQINIEFEIPTFTTVMAIKNKNGETLISGSTDVGNSVHAYKENRDIIYDIDIDSVQLNIKDSVKVGKILNAVLNKSSLQSLYMDMELNNVFFDVSIFSSEFNHLQLTDYELSLKMLSGFDPIEYLMSKLNISVGSISYGDATESSVKFSVLLEDFNPTNYSIDIPAEPLSVDIDYNGTRFAHLKTQDVFIPPYSKYKVAIDLELAVPTVEEKPMLESFVSRFISNESPIDVALHNFKSEKNTNLNRFVNEIALESVTLPQLNFEREEEQKMVSQSASRAGSPFVVGAVFHILNSEIEVTIYNPVSNKDIVIDLHQAESRYNGELLGRTTHAQRFDVPPGIFKTSRIPIKISQGIGRDILKGALNGQLDVDVLASFNLILDAFELELIYNGNGVTSDIKL